jgi:hypothetical protein
VRHFKRELLLPVGRVYDRSTDAIADVALVGAAADSRGRRGGGGLWWRVN